MDEANEARKKLTQSLKEEGYLRSVRAIQAFEKIDRKDFVLKEHEKIAYSDYPLPIPGNATISAPHMHAIVLELLKLKDGDDVLEIGFGSGILLAYICEIAKTGRIVGTEINKKTYDFGEDNLKRTGYDPILLNEDVTRSDKIGRFDKIAVSAAARLMPAGLTKLLKDKGKMIIPVGEYFQNLFVVEKKGRKITERNVGGVAFVPLQ